MPSVHPLVFWYIFMTLILLWLWQDAFRQVSLRTIPYSEFKSHAARGEISECTIEEDEITGKVTQKPATVPTPGAKAEGRPAEPFLFRSVRTEDPKLVEDLQKAGVEFSGVRPGILSHFLWAWLGFGEDVGQNLGVVQIWGETSRSLLVGRTFLSAQGPAADKTVRPTELSPNFEPCQNLPFLRCELLGAGIGGLDHGIGLESPGRLADPDDDGVTVVHLQLAAEEPLEFFVGPGKFSSLAREELAQADLVDDDRIGLPQVGVAANVEMPGDANQRDVIPAEQDHLLDHGPLLACHPIGERQLRPGVPLVERHGPEDAFDPAHAVQVVLNQPCGDAVAATAGSCRSDEPVVRSSDEKAHEKPPTAHHYTVGAIVAAAITLLEQ